MPVHDWSRVDAGIFHAFHHEWISEISRALNHGLLPDDYYALPEQRAVGFGPDVLALKSRYSGQPGVAHFERPSSIALAPPKLQPVAETDLAYYRLKQKHIAVRHASGDELVAIVELVPPGNKSGRRVFQEFVEKAAQLIDLRINLLIVDLHAPGRRDPNGIHAEIWEEVSGEEPALPPPKPFTLASYDCTMSVRAFVEFVAIGDALQDMPLFLEAGLAVEVPLEATYNAAFAETPRRWRQVLEAAG